MLDDDPLANEAQRVNGSFPAAAGVQSSVELCAVSEELKQNSRQNARKLSVAMRTNGFLNKSIKCKSHCKWPCSSKFINYREQLHLRN